MGDDIHIKYLIANEEDLLWGLTVNTVGRQVAEAESIYPPQNHPTRYLFSTEKGRVLGEYQLVYITQGKGTFVSKSQKKVEIKAGDMFLLFPDEWHNYSPDKTTGWHEYWIGFEGHNIDDRVAKGFFKRTEPIFKIGYNEEIIQLFTQSIRTAQKQHAGFQIMLAGIVNHLLGLAFSQGKHSSFENLKVTQQINKAKVFMFEHFQTDLSAEDVANHLNMSYSSFRNAFKEYTGLSPHQYIQELRIQECKILLTNTQLSSEEIAFQVGFKRADYFCTAFKKRTGRTPISYRAFTKGENL